MSILSMQSHVVYGHVGNRSAVFPLERLGFEVWPVNTVQFSNHTGYRSWKGDVFSREHISALIDGLSEMGVLPSCEAVLSGYMGSVQTGMAITAAVKRVKAANPDAVFACDPVMGDDPSGFYVKNDIPSFFSHQVLPLADIVTPNHFEAEYLASMKIRGVEDARAATARIAEIGPGTVLITSFGAQVESGGGTGTTGYFLRYGDSCAVLETPVLGMPYPVSGAGDLAGALFLAYWLRSRNAPEALGRMANAVYSVLDATMRSGSRELALIAAQEAFVHPGNAFAYAEA